MSIPVNVWTVSAAVTLAVWAWMLSREDGGVYDFGAAMIVCAVTVGTVCWWAALLVGRFL